MNKEVVSWEDVKSFVFAVMRKYDEMAISGVYGVPRGGLVLAVMLSYAMNIPLLSAPAENCIIIDDICDSGETLLHYFKNSSGGGRKHYHIVTMYYKPNLLEVKPDYHMFEKKDKWIIFPWEV